MSITSVANIKYLGLFVSANNSSRDHVDYTISEINRKFKFLGILGDCNYGIDPSKSMALYKSFVRSKLEYGAAALANPEKML